MNNKKKKKQPRTYEHIGELKIGKTNYDVFEIDNLKNLIGYEGKYKYLNGMCHQDLATIFLETNNPETQKIRYLYHEIAHAVLREMDKKYGKIRPLMLNRNEKFVEDLGKLIRNVDEAFDLWAKQPKESFWRKIINKFKTK